MSTALRLVPPSERPTATRRTRVRETVEAWRRQYARDVPTDAIERLIDAVTAGDRASAQASKSDVDRLDDAVAEIHAAYRSLDDAESTLATLRRTLTGQPE